jgi:hypothetical protein
VLSLDCWDRGSKPADGTVVRLSCFVVCCAGSGICDGLIASSEESSRVWCVCVYGVSVCVWCVCVCVVCLCVYGVSVCLFVCGVCV